MLTGHTSHQIGLDADIWLTPMPDRQLSPEEREELSPTKVVAADGEDVNPKVWTPGHGAVIRAASGDADVERIFVNAAIKKALAGTPVQTAPGYKRCARGGITIITSTFVFAVLPTILIVRVSRRHRPGDGCGEELDWWFTDAVLHPKPEPPDPRKPEIKMADLPPACRQVLMAP